MGRSFILIVVWLTLTGCASVISTASRALVDPSITFQQLKGQPVRYSGSYALLGGIIAEVRNSADGGELEIIQLALDSRSRPQEEEVTAGRFLARSDQFLDPLVFRPGLQVSLVGQITGETTRDLAGVSYRYPVLLIRELQLFKPRQGSAYPRFHFGIGIGHTF